MFAHWKTWCGSVLSITQPEYVNFGGVAPIMGGDAMHDCGRITTDGGRDLGVAVAASGVVTDQPPELLAGGDHGPRAAAAE